MRGRHYSKLLSVGLLLALLAGPAGSPGLSPHIARAQDGKEGAGSGSVAATPLSSPFTYQGEIRQGGNPVTGACDLQFSLWDSLGAGNQIGATLSPPPVSVVNGLFTVQLNFGSGAFQGDPRWLEIAVCCPSGCDPKVTLTPRQALTPSPYALALPGMWTQPNDVSPNVIGGYGSNSITAGVYSATISGGGLSTGPNMVTDSYGTVGGGRSNRAGDNAGSTTDRWLATVGGGAGNTASGAWSTVGGGINNIASGEDATVAGGWANQATALDAAVGGGYDNVAGAERATVAGGYENAASGGFAAIGGGQAHVASGYGAFVGGGNSNHATLNEATVAGGLLNTAGAKWAAVGGGQSNEATGENATIAGGYDNTASGYSAAIGGGHGNQATDNEATVAGGYQNTASYDWATVGGGRGNVASGGYDTVGGGYGNTASGGYATVPGGSFAVASHHGEMAYASGRFAAAGDAQASVYVMRRVTTTNGVWEDLYLDGSSARLTVASGRTVTFDILVVGRTGYGESAGYRCSGAIENYGGDTALIGGSCEPWENDLDWDAQIQADDAHSALSVQVKGEGETIRWVATVHTVEVSYP